MHAPTLLRHTYALPQDDVDLLLRPAFPATLDLRRAHMQLPLLGKLAPLLAPLPGLEFHHLRKEAAVFCPLPGPAQERLDLHRSELLAASQELHPSLLQSEQGLRVLGEEAKGLVHVSANLAPPSRLDCCGALDQQLQARKFHPFEGGQLEEDHGLPHGPGLAVHRLRQVQLLVEVLQQLPCANALVIDMAEAGHNRGLGDDLVIVPAFLMTDSHRVACTAHLDNLQHAAIPQLLGHGLPIIAVGLVLRVRLDAPNEVGLGEVHKVHQRGKLILELRGNSILLLLAADLLLGGLFLVQDLGVLDVTLKEIGDKGIGAGAHELDEIVAQLVLVLVKERVGAVAHRPSEVLDDEPRGLRLDLIEATMAFVLLHKLIAEALVGAIGHHALLVKHREHTCPLGRQEVHGVLVVREVQPVPRNALPLVELLLELEDE
mmetsp:Transcript_124926/g.266641  ORF Transcript_124926/g.266641 Transcript_124926/m.266641 type:complete len:432 (+) Transcript_124926:2367-3662(+)